MSKTVKSPDQPRPQIHHQITHKNAFFISNNLGGSSAVNKVYKNNRTLFPKIIHGDATQNASLAYVPKALTSMTVGGVRNQRHQRASKITSSLLYSRLYKQPFLQKASPGEPCHSAAPQTSDCLSPAWMSASWLRLPPSASAAPPATPRHRIIHQH